MNPATRPTRRRCEIRKIQASRAWICLIAAGLLSVSAAFGCRSRAAEAPGAALPDYSAEESTVFNDFFRPELFGLQPNGAAPEDDALLRARVARADVVVAVRIVTLTREVGGREASYSVVAQPVASPLVGRVSEGPLVLTVRSKSLAYGWIEANRDACVGTRALIFARRYADGLHFHASLDTPAVRDAVIRATIGESRAP